MTDTTDRCCNHCCAAGDNDTPFTADEVLAALGDEHRIDWDFYFDRKIILRGVEYDVKKVAETGGMDEGSHASVTIQVGTQYFQKNGYYASHYGYDWDGDFTEVFRKEKTVVVYE